MSERTKQLSERPYVTVILREQNPDGFTGYFAYHPDLPGCMAQGQTVVEARDSLREARELWIENLLEDGLPVPEPQPLFSSALARNDAPQGADFEAPYSPTLRALHRA